MDPFSSTEKERGSITRWDSTLYPNKNPSPLQPFISPKKLWGPFFYPRSPNFLPMKLILSLLCLYIINRWRLKRTHLQPVSILVTFFSRILVLKVWGIDQ